MQSKQQVFISLFFGSFIFIIGLVQILITPPFHNYDERLHFYKDFSMTEGIWRSDLVLVDYPSSFREVEKIVFDSIWHYSNPNNTVDTPIKKIKIATYLNLFNKDINLRNRYKSDRSGYSPWLYLPATIGTYIGKKLNFNPIINIYLSRITNFLVCFLILIFAFGYAKNFKALFIYVILLPTTFSQFLTCSHDAVINALSVLFFSMLFYFFLDQKNKMSLFNCLILLGSSTLIIAAKPPYYLIIFGFAYLVYLQNFKLLHKVILITCMFLLPILWYFFTISIHFQSDLNLIGVISTNVNNASFGSVFISKTVLIVNTLKVNGSLYIHQIIGVLGAGDVFLPKIQYFFSILLGFLILIVKTNESTNSTQSLKENLLFYTIIAISSIFIVLSIFYIASTVPDFIQNDTIGGVQGRYITPLLLSVIWIPYSMMNGFKLDKTLFWIIFLIFEIMLMFCTVTAIFNRFYEI